MSTSTTSTRGAPAAALPTSTTDRVPLHPSQSHQTSFTHTNDDHSPIDEKAGFAASVADPASGTGQAQGKQVLDHARHDPHGTDGRTSSSRTNLNPDGGDAKSETAGVAGPSLYSHGFFDRELRPLRAVIFKALFATLVLLTLVMWASVTAYWGSLWHSNEYTNHLKFLIINNDLSPGLSGLITTPLLGTYLSSALLANANGSLTGGSTVGTLGYELYTGSEVYTTAQIEHLVHEQTYWGAVVISTDATARLRSARQQGDATFDPKSLVSFYYEQARNENAANYYVAINSAAVTGALARWGAESAGEYLTANSGNSTAITLLAAAPQTISPGASWTSYNLRPYNQPVATALLLVGSIYSIIFTFIITMAWNGVRGIIAPYLTTKSLILARVFVPLVLYIPVSLVYSMVNLPFRVIFDAHFSSYAGGFFVFWLYIYMSMAANGLATEFFITVLTMRFVAFSLLPLILVQVSVGSLPKELQPRIFHYGTAVPVQRISHAVRTIIFDTKDTLGEDAGIIIAWIFCSIITVSLATWIFRRKEIKAAEKASASKSAAA